MCALQDNLCDLQMKKDNLRVELNNGKTFLSEIKSALSFLKLPPAVKLNKRKFFVKTLDKA
jgi:hypothetical protein